MQPAITFDLVQTNGHIIKSWKEYPCFGVVWSEELKDKGIVYFPNIRVSELEAIEFLSDMKEVGFNISDSVAVVQDKKYSLYFDKTMSKAWFWGNFTLVRYLEEFTRIVYEYLLLKALLPKTTNKYHLLQLAHFTRLSKKGDAFGQGHCLLDVFFISFPNEYPPWSSVIYQNKHKQKRIHNMFGGFRKAEFVWKDKDLRDPNAVKKLHDQIMANEKTEDFYC